MAIAFVILCAAFSVANAGVAVTTTSDNTYRSSGNLAQVSTQSKMENTPFSSSSKSDVRVSNPTVYATAAPAVAYNTAATPIYANAPLSANHAAPAFSYAVNALPAVNYAAPAAAYAAHAPVATYAAHAPAAAYATHASAGQAFNYPVPVAHSGPVYAGPVLAKTAYATPVGVAHQAPVAYTAPAYTHAAPVSYGNTLALPAAGYTPTAHVAAPTHQHVFAFSPANEVAHLTYSNVNDHVNYAWK